MSMQLGLGSYAYRWAVGTASFRPDRPASVVDLIESSASLGVDLLQVADNRELDTADDTRLAAIKAAADERGVRLQVGFSGATAAQFDRYLHVARRLGADVVRVVLHDAAGRADDARAALRDAASSYADAGVAIGIENHFLTPSPEMIEIVESAANPAVGVILDVGNSIVCGEWPQTTIELLAPYAIGMHLKDFDLVPDAEGVGGHLVGRPLGEGRTDIQAALDAVSSATPPFGGDFAVILEQWSPRGSDDADTLAIESRWRERSVRAARDCSQLAATERTRDAGS